MATISVFKNAKTPDNPSNVDSATIVGYIRDGRWKKLVDKLNSFPSDSPEQKKYKSTLPAICWQGTFTYRKEENIIEHSGMAALDFDGIPSEKMQEYRKILTDFPYTHVLFTSPRRSGLKVVVKIPPDIEKHKEYLSALKHKFASEYYDHYDDLVRLCFVSYDPDLYYNPDSEVWTETAPVDKKKSKAPTPAGTTDDIAGVFRRIKVWADKEYGYTDGNKHNHLIGIFSACLRFGIPRKDAIELVWNAYGTTEGTEAVDYDDYCTRADSVYQLYAAEFGTQKFDDPPPPPPPDEEEVVADPPPILQDPLPAVIEKKRGRPKQEFTPTPHEHTGDTEDRLDNYIRVGSDYFRRIKKIDRNGIERIEIKPWKKDEIKVDFGRNAPHYVAKYADFCISPDNINYRSIVNGCYNLYKPFPHKPAEGPCEWSLKLMEHIFGEQLDLGMRYMQILYLHPRRIAPILALVSAARQTGKTTFLNWLNMIFGSNMTVITPDVLHGQFNHAYALSNIIAIDEAFIEKDTVVEKLKSLSTGQKLSINQKFVNQYNVDFYGKFILTSNKEDKFARIEDEEIRFFIRKVPLPKVYNHAIETELVKEIPAFLHYLTTLPPVDFSVDRTGFTKEELTNSSLDDVKRESKSWLYKAMKMLIEELFNNDFNDKTEFKADIISIKERLFKTDHRVDLTFIRNTLKNEFKLVPAEKPERFYPFCTMDSKSARPYLFKREWFTQEPQKSDQQVVTTESDTPF